MELLQKTDPEMLRYWVWLSLVFGAGSSKLLQYLDAADTPQEVYENVQAGLYHDLPQSAQKAMMAHSIGEADSLVYFCRSHDIALLTIDSAEYPSILRNIGTPPVLLTAKGDLSLLENPLCLAVVGTRHPSPYTERVTQHIVGELSKRGFVIVSGFAKGVDGIAHTTALEYGGKTIAVLGCGINVNYPREHQVLRDRMISGGNGLLLSEYMPGTQPFPANFPRRNRILSGLCHATAVMEAAERSGSLSTAQYANDQGRYLYCVPPADIFDPRYQGVASLLRDGAYPLLGYEDIMLSYYSRFPQYITHQQEPDLRDSERLVYAENKPEPKPLPAAEPAKAASGSPMPAPAKTAPPEPQEDAVSLPESEDGRAIVQYLRECGESYADDIAAALDMDLSTLLGELTMLELDGFVETLFGKHYRAADR